MKNFYIFKQIFSSQDDQYSLKMAMTIQPCVSMNLILGYKGDRQINIISIHITPHSQSFACWGKENYNGRNLSDFTTYTCRITQITCCKWCIGLSGFLNETKISKISTLNSLQYFLYDTIVLFMTHKQFSIIKKIWFIQGIF